METKALTQTFSPNMLWIEFVGFALLILATRLH